MILVEQGNDRERARAVLLLALAAEARVVFEVAHHQRLARFRHLSGKPFAELHARPRHHILGDIARGADLHLVRALVQQHQRQTPDSISLKHITRQVNLKKL